MSEKSSSDRKEKKQKRDKERLSNIDGDSNADNESDQRRLEKRIKEKEERKKQKEKMRRSEGVSLEMKEKLKKDKRKTIATSDGKESHRNGNKTFMNNSRDIRAGVEIHRGTIRGTARYSSCNNLRGFLGIFMFPSSRSRENERVIEKKKRKSAEEQPSEVSQD